MFAVVHVGLTLLFFVSNTIVDVDTKKQRKGQQQKDVISIDYDTLMPIFTGKVEVVLT